LHRSVKKNMLVLPVFVPFLLAQISLDSFYSPNSNILLEYIIPLWMIHFYFDKL
jgi:hypothetical protein